MSRILVIGATGTVGSSVIQELVQRGKHVRAVTSRAPRVNSSHVEWAQADLRSGKGVDQAFENVSHAFIFSPPGFADQHAVNIPLIEHAKRHRLEKVVLMTAMGANANPKSPLRLSELALEDSGLAYNIVRPNWFMQNFNQSWLPGMLATGKIQLPAGHAKTSFIDARDVAAVITRLLTSDGLDNRDFDITGVRALDHHEVAAILSRVTGKNIVYESIEPWVWRQGVLDAGARADYADFLLLILSFLAAGFNDRITNTVESLLGRAPISFARYALDHRHTWAGVRAA